MTAAPTRPSSRPSSRPRRTPRPTSSRAATASSGSVARPRSRRPRSTAPTRPRSRTTACAIDHYRTVVAADVLHQKLQDKIVASLVGPGPQRHVSEIYIKAADPAAGRRRHQGPAHPVLAERRPGERLEGRQPTIPPGRGPARWRPRRTPGSRRTRACSIRSRARRATRNRRSARPAPAASSRTSTARCSVDPAFLAAILDPSLKPGDILPPVQSAFGWHVIQVMYRPSDIDHLNDLKTQSDKGADFAVLARDNSEAPTASAGGDLGWIAKGQLSQALTDAIFAAPVGKTSEVITIGRGRFVPVQGPRRGDPDARGPAAPRSSPRPPSRPGTTRRSRR